MDAQDLGRALGLRGARGGVTARPGLALGEIGMPTRWPALTALASVPPQVNSTSSRWAAMASKSTSCEVTVPLRVRNAECGMRNGPRGRRVAWLASAIG